MIVSLNMTMSEYEYECEFDCDLVEYIGMKMIEYEQE